MVDRTAHKPILTKGSLVAKNGRGRQIFEQIKDIITPVDPRTGERLPITSVELTVEQPTLVKLAILGGALVLFNNFIRKRF